MPELKKVIRNFLLPSFNSRFVIRLLCVIAGTLIICRYAVTPAFTNGESMMPTYRTMQFLPVWRLKFLFREPRPGEVVMVRYASERVMLLKRVVATAGQRVAFHEGWLYIDGERCEEPWAHLTECDWELEERTVQPGEVYVIGDNRTMPMAEHVFGAVSIKRIAGAPLW